MRTVNYNKERVSKFLKEHIMRGDKGDGIPNFLSNDDVFVNGARQSPVYGAKVDLWLTQTPEEFCDEKMLRNYKRNQQLVDFQCIPENVSQAILDEFNKPIQGSRSQVMGYLAKNHMKHLIEVLGDF